MSKMIEVSGLTKSYGEIRAVRGIDFDVEQGQLFAFLGPNGAGKSTTIDILCTLLKADSGRVVINGHVLGGADSRIRSSIGVVFQDHLLDPLLTVRENLMTRGSFYKIPRAVLREKVGQAAQSAGVTDFIDRRYGSLSGGQRRRADIARALVNAPKILFLDEPTTGLDPQTRGNIWQTIRTLQSENKMTVLMTTHYMEEAARADYVVIIDHGLLVAQGTPDELRHRYTSDTLRMTAPDADGLKAVLDGLGVDYTASGIQFTLKLKSTVDSVAILARCQEYLTHIEVQSGTMDDVFIAITGKEIRE
ncbi:Sulfate-transporting ATPase [Syntrophobotulus glycolicus DSM 8271]|uniref:Sulfate-transporting ATPase n=1 Tax=Syntrophobotulus glycolicus (strain DSM 8271 / FlGlyR) TaxID=645991 RepID=F0SWE2_SYNGF|nr:ABC transporter ATP-binding protein [Syntrophobotulus glycolicus]ADY55708.1 Sulfate-transporting ATPase [Syntrophobotulus glycolicus DSM 8271]